MRKVKKPVNMKELTPEEEARVEEVMAKTKRKNAFERARYRDKAEERRAQREAAATTDVTAQTTPEKKKTVTPMQKELALRELARRKLIHFTKRFKPDYEAGWVHEDICRRLEKFFKEVEEKKSPRLMLFLPPRHGKSELASINFPAWALGHRPEFEIIAGSYAVSLPEKFSRIVQQKLRDPAYKAMFPHTYINSKNQGIEAWTTTNGGGYVAAGVGGGITGKGAHILILDDTTKDAEEADSENQRKKVWDWYGSTAYTRLAPGGGVLIIMTRWHDDDLAGRALTQQKDNIKAEVPAEEIDNWEVVQYPAIATQDEYQDVASGEILYLNGNTGEYTNLLGYTIEPEAQPKRLRRKGEALHEARFPEADLKRIQRSLQPRHWSALYQQNPVPDEGVYFTKTMFRTSPTPSLSDMDIYIAWDLAIGEKQTNDWTVGVVGGLDEHDQLHILDVVRFRGDTYAISEAILNTYKKWKPELVGAEKGVIELAIMPVLKKMMSKQRTYISFDDELKPVNDKMKRARPLQGRMQQGVIFFPENSPEWYEVLKHEFLRFPGGLHDDIVDAAAWLCKMVLKRTPPRPKGRQKHKSWRDKVKGMTRGTKHPMMA